MIDFSFLSPVAIWAITAAMSRGFDEEQQLIEALSAEKQDYISKVKLLTDNLVEMQKIKHLNYRKYDFIV